MVNKENLLWKPAVVLIGYLLIAVLFFGLYPLTHISTSLAGMNTDPLIYLWSATWWKYAISHSLNPFITQYIWAPDGFNLTRATSMPGFSLLTLPIQLLAGPEAAYNIAFIAAPALAAWTMFLLCYHLVKRKGPAIFAGYFFGFSGYMIPHMLAHLNLIFGIFLIPILILLAILHIENQIKKWLFVLTNWICLTFLFLISTEIFLTFTVCGFIAALFAGFFFLGFKQFFNLIKIYFVVYFFVILIVSPFLYYFFSTQNNVVYLHNPVDYANNVIRVLIPDKNFWFSKDFLLEKSTQVQLSEKNGYLGLPLLLIITLFIINSFRTKIGKYLILMMMIFMLLSFGTFIHFGTKFSFSFLPTMIFYKLPLIKYSLPCRYSLYTDFVAAIIVAYCLSQNNLIYAKYIIATLAIISLIPAHSFMTAPYIKLNNPNFFSQGRYIHWITKKGVVLILPASNAMQNYFQLKTNFYFKMATGNLGVLPEIDRLFKENQIFNRDPKKIKVESLQNFLIEKQVQDIIVLDKNYETWRSLLQQLPLNSPIHFQGVWLYRVNLSQNSQSND